MAIVLLLYCQCLVSGPPTDRWRGRANSQSGINLVLNIPLCASPVADEHGHLKIYLPKKLLECLPKCTSLPKERHRWNTNEVWLLPLSTALSYNSISVKPCPSRLCYSPRSLLDTFVRRLNLVFKAMSDFFHGRAGGFRSAAIIMLTVAFFLTY